MNPAHDIQVSGPSHGSLTLASDGSLVYVPNAAYAGSDSFSYKNFDGASYSIVAMVTLDVTNQAPTAGNDSYSVVHLQTLGV